MKTPKNLNGHVILELARDGLAQFLRTLVAADFHNAGADFDLDGALVEFAIAGRTGFFSHDSSPYPPAFRAGIGDHLASTAAVEIFSYC
jgi:hypothetical protein